MQPALYIIALILNAGLGAVIGRMDGGGTTLPHAKLLARICIGLWLVIPCIEFAGWYALVSVAGIVGIIMGHGLYYSLGRPVRAITPETIDPAVRLLFGQDPRCAAEFTHLREVPEYELTGEQKDQIATAMTVYGTRRLYWRCLCGLAIGGLITGLPAAILALCFGQWLTAVCFLGLAIAKPAAYAIGWAAFNNSESGEAIHGGFRTTLCLLALSAAVLSLPR